MPFLDIKETDVGYEAIKFCYEIGLLCGNPDGTFRPEDSLTWGEAYTVVARFIVNDATVGPGNWPENYIKFCVKMGLINDNDIRQKISDRILFKDTHMLFEGLKRSRPFLEIPELSRYFFRNDITTRRTIAILIYDICRETGPVVSQEVLSKNSNELWQGSIQLLFEYKFCIKFIDADIAHIFDLINKNIKQNEAEQTKAYEFMVRILHCKNRFPRVNSGIIYHYTSMKALEKLTQPNAKLRLSNVAYLNDSKEGRLLIERIKNCFNEIEFSKWQFLERECDELSVSYSFIASFCKRAGEYLPLWVQYGDNAAGCRLGICADSISSPIYEVIYDKKEMDCYINDIKAILLAYRKKHRKININKDVVFLYANQALTQSSYLFKDNYYKHEQEVRILSFVDSFHVKEEQQIRDGEFFPRFFVELNDSLQISSILLGPKAKGIEQIAFALSQRATTTSAIISKSKIQLR